MDRQLVKEMVAEHGFKARDDVISALLRFREAYSRSLVRRCPRDSNGNVTP